MEEEEQQWKSKKKNAESQCDRSNDQFLGSTNGVSMWGTQLTAWLKVKEVKEPRTPSSPRQSL